MTHTILFLPGIMGSNLDLPDGERVWPPKPLETVFGYKRIQKLQSQDAQPAGIIEKVACFGFYDTILQYFSQLGYGQGGDRRLLALDYDWRRDLFDIADDIADRVTASLATPGGDDRLSIVGHSMGGLVGRLLLESGRFDSRAWFPKVDLFVTLSTPHLGAPLALARTLGLDNAVGISGADFKKLSQNPDFPSGYQLLPAPGEEACWNVGTGGALEPIDIYDPAQAAALGLVPTLVDRAKALHDAFAAGAAPGHVRYFYFAGTGHKTVSRVNVDGFGAPGATVKKVQTRGAGDGTVPMWSSLPRPAQKHAVVNEHATVFRGESFKNVFFALFGQPIGPVDLEMVPGKIPVSMSLSHPVFHLADRMEGIEVVVDGAAGISDLAARFVVQSVDEKAEPSGEYREEVPLAYSGPALRTLTLDLEMPETAGFYQLALELVEEDGQAFPVVDPVMFSVSR